MSDQLPTTPASGTSGEQPPSAPASGSTGINDLPTPTTPSPETPTQPNSGATPGVPNTQGPPEFRKGWAAWLKELPRLKFEPPKPDISAPLIKPEELRALLKDYAAEEAEIEADMEYMNHELLRLFRQRDHEAKLQQNRYRLYQILYLVLAATAATFGAAQALALAGNPDSVPLWSLLETIVALLVVFLASMSGREAPLPLWLINRRRAEHLRREYFRYLMHIPPYDEPVLYKRQTLLSERAADINRGVNPDEREGGL